MTPKRRPDTAPDGGPPIKLVNEPPTEPAGQPEADATLDPPVWVPPLVDGMNEAGRRLDALERAERNRNALSLVPEVPAVYAAMWAVMRQVRGIGKHGTMAAQAGGYRFRKYDDLKLALGEAFREHGLMVQTHDILDAQREVRGQMMHVVVTVRYRFTSLADGSEVTFTSVGEGADRGDKATGKAMTMALKTALDQAFMLAAEDIEDPDAVRPEMTEDTPPVDARTLFPPDSPGVVRDVSGAPDARPDPNSTADDPWDLGAPPSTQGNDAADQTAKARAALTAAQQPGVDHARWNEITEHARKLGLMRVEIDGMPLQRHLVAIARTLAKE
jgi:hypothetical protein